MAASFHCSSVLLQDRAQTQTGWQRQKAPARLNRLAPSASEQNQHAVCSETRLLAAKYQAVLSQWEVKNEVIANFDRDIEKITVVWKWVKWGSEWNVCSVSGTMCRQWHSEQSVTFCRLGKAAKLCLFQHCLFLHEPPLWNEAAWFFDWFLYSHPPSMSMSLYSKLKSIIKMACL